MKRRNKGLMLLVTLLLITLFNKKTYKSLVKLTAWLEMVCGLNEDHVIRHYDITGKECPRYYVKHEDAWKKFKKDVKKYRK